MSSEDFVKLAALHRHWVVADSIRVVLQQKLLNSKEEVDVIHKFGLDYIVFGEKVSMLCRMQVWYSLLFVVIEGYKELGMNFAPLENVLENSENVSLLRRYRNATFHYQADPLNDKIIDFLNKDGSEIWIRDLNAQLEAFFMWALPLDEALKKIEIEGVPSIPLGTRLSVMFSLDKD